MTDHFYLTLRIKNPIDPCSREVSEMLKKSLQPGWQKRVKLPKLRKVASTPEEPNEMD